MVEKLKKTRAELESKSGSYKPDELYMLLQVYNNFSPRNHEPTQTNLVNLVKGKATKY